MTDSDRSGKRSGSAARRSHQERVQGPRVGLGRQAVAVGHGDVDDALPALRRAHDAAHDREALALEEARDGAVGGDHEVLDQLLGAVALLGREPAHRVAVERGLHLDRLELQRTVLVAVGLEALGGLVLEPEVVGQPGDGRSRRRQRPWPSSQAPTPR